MIHTNNYSAKILKDPALFHQGYFLCTSLNILRNKIKKNYIEYNEKLHGIVL